MSDFIIPGKNILQLRALSIVNIASRLLNSKELVFNSVICIIVLRAFMSAPEVLPREAERLVVDPIPKDSAPDLRKDHGILGCVWSSVVDRIVPLRFS